MARTSLWRPIGRVLLLIAAGPSSGSRACPDGRDGHTQNQRSVATLRVLSSLTRATSRVAFPSPHHPWATLFLSLQLLQTESVLDAAS